MAESKTKSRTFRRITKKTPGNRSAKFFVKKKPSKAACGHCGIILKGISTRSHKKLSKTQRRPERPFGGVLCSKCSRENIKSMARAVK